MPAPELIVIQPSLVIAVQLQVLPTVTLKLLLPPAGPNAWLVGLSIKVQVTFGLKSAWPRCFLDSLRCTPCEPSSVVESCLLSRLSPPSCAWARPANGCSAAARTTKNVRTIMTRRGVAFINPPSWKLIISDVCRCDRRIITKNGRKRQAQIDLRFFKAPQATTADGQLLSHCRLCPHAFRRQGRFAGQL